jgi:hypothetical protein
MVQTFSSINIATKNRTNLLKYPVLHINRIERIGMGVTFSSNDLKIIFERSYVCFLKKAS